MLRINLTNLIEIKHKKQDVVKLFLRRTFVP